MPDKPTITALKTTAKRLKYMSKYFPTTQIREQEVIRKQVRPERGNLRFVDGTF